MSISILNYIHLRNGKFACGSNADFEKLFENYKKDPKRGTLVVHFHGGLVNYNSGIAMADRLKKEYESCGAYPVFFIWESALEETVKNNLNEIFNNNFFNMLAKNITLFLLEKLREITVQQGKNFKMPSVEAEMEKHKKGKKTFAEIDITPLKSLDALSNEQIEQFKCILHQDTNLIKEVQRLEDRLQPAPHMTHSDRRVNEFHNMFSRDLLDEFSKDTNGPNTKSVHLKLITIAENIIKRIQERFAQGHDHGFYPTIVEEICRGIFNNPGKMVWDLMKNDTLDSFMGYGKPESQLYGGTQFLTALKKYWLEGNKPRVVLIGHSAGAIYICHLLAAAKEQGLPSDLKFELVFLAPACTFALFAETIKNYSTCIANYRLFGMNDKLEQADKMHFLYPHSLLYAISGILEDNADEPILGMERFYTGKSPYDPAKNDNLKAVLNYTNSNQTRILWSMDNKGPGLASSAISHSAFEKDATTLKSIKHIIAKGFK